MPLFQSTVITYLAATGLFAALASCASIPPIERALERFDLQRVDFVSRCAVSDRPWPSYRDVFYLSVRRVEQGSPVNDRRIAIKDVGDLELKFECGYEFVQQWES